MVQGCDFGTDGGSNCAGKLLVDVNKLHCAGRDGSEFEAGTERSDGRDVGRQGRLGG